MFEETEVCIHCGRPVQGRAYCSNECESRDSASPSVSSAASSAYPSPYLPYMKNPPGNLDVPTLVPSALGHRPRHSISSSNSSTAWSAVTDEDEEDVYVLNEQYRDMLSVEGQKSPRFQASPGLLYARRPSTTNHRSTVPMLNRHTSAASSSVSSFGLSQGIPSPFYPSTEDDTSSLCISELSLHDETDAASIRRKAKRTSLPTYFSLLQGSSVSSAAASPPVASSPARRAPSALQAISRSLHASPTTPKVSHATAALTTTAAQAHIASRGPVASTSTGERGRGRHRERDPDVRSASSRRSAARSPPRQRQLSALQRARLDSVEKVAEWVSASPVVVAARRNSSPQRRPRYGFVEALTRGLQGCAVDSEDDEEDEGRREREAHERTLRGRRRVDELGDPPMHDAPGLGGGRSGLKARERGRATVARPVGIAIR